MSREAHVRFWEGLGVRFPRPTRHTGFHQWTTRWKFAHVFVHDGHAMLCLYWLFFAAFNLLTIFLYRQLRSYGRDRGKDVTRTISRFIDEMLDELARLVASPWDTS